MIFPDGTMKEGYFENNIFVGPVPSKAMMQMQQNENSKFKTPGRANNQSISIVGGG
jgi:cell division septation protein DedD